jgi:hypothetical protein
VRLRDAQGNLLGEVHNVGGSELVTYTLAEELNAVRPAHDWGPWQLDAGRLVLWHDLDGGYEVDLEQCLTSAEVLDWIAQILHKGWGAATVAGLVRALDDVLHPQRNLCSGGQPREITTARVRELARDAAAIREQSLAIYRDDL